MRLLIVGAGAVGGYFGARLVESGADVTFLLKGGYKEAIQKTGLEIVSSFGDISFIPQVVTRERLQAGYDLIIFSCKAYNIEKAVQDIQPAVTENVCILPMQNGVHHLQYLDRQFGRERVMGGVAHLAVNRDMEGRIHHLSDFHRFIYGTRHDEQSTCAELLEQLLSNTILEHELSENIQVSMWEKFVFLAALAGSTCLFRGSIGEILRTDRGREFILDILNECMTIAEASDVSLSEEAVRNYIELLTEADSEYTASMLRDIRSGMATEAGHILGDMMKRGVELGVPTRLIGYAYSHMQVYERQRSIMN